MADDPGISPIPIGAPPATGGKKTPPAGDGSEVVRLEPRPAEPPPGADPVPLPVAPAPVSAPAPVGGGAGEGAEGFPRHAFAGVAGVALLVAALFVPNWGWARAFAEGAADPVVLAWIAGHAGGEPFAGTLWEGLRAALLTAAGGTTAFGLYRRVLRYRSVWRVVLHVGATSLALVLLGIVLKSLGSDSTRWDFSDVLTSAGLVYPVVAMFWSRPRWAQLVLAVAAFGIGWWAATQPEPESFTAAQRSLLPLLPALGLMLLGLAVGEALLAPHVAKVPGKPGVRGAVVCIAGVALGTAGWALLKFGFAHLQLPGAPLGVVLIGAGAAVALAAVLHFVPLRALPFVAVGSWGVLFYASLHTVAPAVHSVLQTHFRPGYLGFAGVEITPLLQNMFVAALLWAAAAWLDRRTTPRP